MSTSRGSDLGPDDARAILRAWLASVGLGHLSGEELLAWLQADGFSHADLYRRARRIHERGLAAVVTTVLTEAAKGAGAGAGRAAAELFDASVAAIPYAPAAAFLAREKRRRTAGEHEPLRVALVADGVGAMHGVTHTPDEIRERGVPGFEVEVIGTDPHVDRRLSAVAEVEIPFYPDVRVGVPSLPAMVETLADGRYDVLHLCTPGPAGVAAGLIGRIMELPTVGSYHTELASYAGLRSGSEALELGVRLALGAFYGQAGHVLSPSADSDAKLVALRIPAERIGRWDRGVDLDRFSPSRRRPGRFGPDPTRVNVLYAGRLTRERGMGLLADAFEQARSRDPRLHLVLAGGGPEREALAERLGEHVTCLGWLEGDALASACVSADLFLFASRTDTFGQVVLEAQASGLPVVAVGIGGPAELIADGRSGLALPAERRGDRGGGRRPGGIAGGARTARSRGPGGGRAAQLGAGARPARRRLPPRAGGGRRRAGRHG